MKQWMTGVAIGVALWYGGSWLWEAFTYPPFSCEARAADVEAEIAQELEQLARIALAVDLYMDQVGLPHDKPEISTNFEVTDVRDLVREKYKRLSAANMAASMMKGDSKPSRPLDADELGGRKLRCALTWTKYDAELNKMVSEDVQYTVVRRADGKGYLTKRQEDE